MKNTSDYPVPIPAHAAGANRPSPGPRQKCGRRERSPSVYEKGTTPLFEMGEYLFPPPVPKRKKLRGGKNLWPFRLGPERILSLHSPFHYAIEKFQEWPRASFRRRFRTGGESVYLSGKCDSILPVKTFSDPNRLVPISLAVKEEGNFSA